MSLMGKFQFLEEKMKNKITDLNNHLFACLERLNDEELSAEELDCEVKRSKTAAELASQIVKSYEVSLSAVKLADELGYSLKSNSQALLLLGAENEE